MKNSIYQKSGMDIKYVPSELLNTIQSVRSTSPNHFGLNHPPAKTYADINVSALNALVLRTKVLNGDSDSLAVCRMAYDTLSGEWETSDEYHIGYLTQSGTIRLSVVQKATGQSFPLPGLTTSELGDRLTLVFALAIEMMAAAVQEFAEMLAEMQELYRQTKTFSESMMRKACDSVENAIFAADNASGQYALCINSRGGKIEAVSPSTLTRNGLAGDVIYGTPTHINPQGGKARKKPLKTVGQAKKYPMFQQFRENQSWTEKEQKLIPTLPDDFPLLPEVQRMATMYISTSGDRRPMRNFMWRGVTSYGKSTGVEALACVLGIPLVRVTCNSNMETQDFLSNMVPVADQPSDREDVSIPGYWDMTANPAAVYKQLTGEDKPTATEEDAFRAIVKAVARKAGARQSMFKQVESPFVTGLRSGYIVEVQELSRIKDPGVMVGLNEYDRPGARIPLVNGEFVTRHPNACVIYTDNVGYESCRPIDPSVLRRMAVIFDSYELKKKDVLDRIRYNTGFADNNLLDLMYGVWNGLAEYCRTKGIEGGSISVTELEMWAQVVMADGYGNQAVIDGFDICVVSKATSDVDEQQELRLFGQSRLNLN